MNESELSEKKKKVNLAVIDGALPIVPKEKKKVEMSIATIKQPSVVSNFLATSNRFFIVKVSQLDSLKLLL